MVTTGWDMRLLLAIVLLSVPALCAAQTFDDDLASVIDGAILPRVADGRHAAPSADGPDRGFSTVRFILMRSIALYQRVISSQDMSPCNYYPSCSNFGARAIGTAGPLRGLLLTSDRLQRCNGFAVQASAYRYDFARGKFLDPLERYIEAREACCEKR